MFRLLHFLSSYKYSERAQNLSIRALRGIKKFGLSPLVRFKYNYKHPLLERELLGVKFKNPVGLAAGFDKSGDRYNLLSDLGFGFIEIGSLTLLKQTHNTPNIYFLPKDEALINDSVINNLGVRHAVNYLKKNKPNCIIGANITSCISENMQKMIHEYELAFEYLYDFVDYFVLNVSLSDVNTFGNISSLEELSEILDPLLTIRNMYDEYRPILLKVTPDMNISDLDEVIALSLVSGLDGIIATNGTYKRENLNSSQRVLNRAQDGILCGKPLYNRSLEFVKYIYKKTNGQLPIIASGGIFTSEQAKEMLNSGASLIQIYSSFIYKGAKIVKRINKYIVKCAKNEALKVNNPQKKEKQREVKK